MNIAFILQYWIRVCVSSPPLIWHHQNLSSLKWLRTTELYSNSSQIHHCNYVLIFPSKRSVTNYSFTYVETVLASVSFCPVGLPWGVLEVLWACASGSLHRGALMPGLTLELAVDLKVEPHFSFHSSFQGIFTELTKNFFPSCLKELGNFLAKINTFVVEIYYRIIFQP